MKKPGNFPDSPLFITVSNRVRPRWNTLNFETSLSGVTIMRDLVLWFAGVPIVAIIALHLMGFLK